MIGGNSHHMNAIGPAGSAAGGAAATSMGHHAAAGGMHPAESNAESLMSDSEHRKSRQEEDAANPRKEKSVLQAKLTKLAIQIGYGGKREPRNDLRMEQNNDAYLTYLFFCVCRFGNSGANCGHSHTTLCLQDVRLWQ